MNRFYVWLTFMGFVLLMGCNPRVNPEMIRFISIGNKIDSEDLHGNMYYDWNSEIVIFDRNGITFKGLVGHLKKDQYGICYFPNYPKNFPLLWDKLYGEGYFKRNIENSTDLCRGKLSDKFGNTIYLELYQPITNSIRRDGVGVKNDNQIFKITVESAAHAPSLHSMLRPYELLQEHPVTTSADRTQWFDLHEGALLLTCLALLPEQ